MSTKQTSHTAPYKRPGAPKAVVGYTYATPSARYAKQPLKKWQKRELSMRARAAFDRLVKYGAIEQPEGLSVSAWFEQWKHAEQGRALKAAGPVSLNDCKQAHVRDLETWFDSLSGNVTPRTFDRALKSEDVDEGRRQMRHHLSEELEKINTPLAAAGCEPLAESYAETICQSTFKCGLDELPPECFPSLFATLRRRGNSRLGKGKEQRAKGGE